MVPKKILFISKFTVRLQLKERSPRNKTPKKNGKILKDSVESEDAPPPSIPNLRLEAKLKAEVSNCALI